MLLTDLFQKREDADSSSSVYAFDCAGLFGARKKNWIDQAQAAFTHVREKGYGAAVLYNAAGFSVHEIDELITTAKRTGFNRIKIEINMDEINTASRMVERLGATGIDEACFVLKDFRDLTGMKLIEKMAGLKKTSHQRITLAVKCEIAGDIHELEQSIRRISKARVERIVLIAKEKEKRNKAAERSMKTTCEALARELDVTIEIQSDESVAVFRGFSARKNEARELLLDIPYFYLAGKPVALGAVFQLGFRCGQNCVFCTSDRSLPEPDDSFISRKLDDVLNIGAPRVVFTGGEPTMNKGLAGYIGKCAGAGVGEISVYSNGMAFSSKTYTNSLATAGMNLALVSLHAGDERISDSITRRRGGFNKTVAGIENLINEGIFTIINCVVCSGNFSRLEKYVEFLARRFPGVALNFSYIAPIARHTARPEIVPRFSDAAPHIKAALDRCGALEIPVSGLEPHWGIPPCMLDADDRYFPALQPLQEKFSGFVKSGDCGRCALNACCPGVRKHYAELYGLNEIIPYAKT